MKTIQWGKPSEGQAKTVLSFYIASDIITPSLKELREDQAMANFLQATQCTMVSHALTESHTQVLCYFAGKDIQHTYRQDLHHRLANHLQQHLGPPGIQ